METLIKEINKYLKENDNFISVEQGMDEHDIERAGVYAFVYLDEDECLTTDTRAARNNFSAELTYLNSSDEEVWDKLTFNLGDPNWLEVLEELAEKVCEYRD